METLTLAEATLLGNVRQMDDTAGVLHGIS